MRCGEKAAVRAHAQRAAAFDVDRQSHATLRGDIHQQYFIAVSDDACASGREADVPEGGALCIDTGSFAATARVADDQVALLRSGDQPVVLAGAPRRPAGKDATTRAPSLESRASSS